MFKVNNDIEGKNKVFSDCTSPSGFSLTLNPALPFRQIRVMERLHASSNVQLVSPKVKITFVFHKVCELHNKNTGRGKYFPLRCTHRTKRKAG